MRSPQSASLKRYSIFVTMARIFKARFLHAWRKRFSISSETRAPMKIAALFVDLYMVKGPNEHCHLEDLAWAWKAFMMETGISPPEDWLRTLILEHGVVLQEPAPGQVWRGWRVDGLALNPETAKRYNRYRLERMGVGT